MMNRDECEAVLLEQLDWTRHAMLAISRRYGVGGADAEDFVSWATLKLIEDDYAVLRRFRGESAVRTYLAVVIAMLHRDYRARFWGRWRPSAAARRDGPLAVELERLTRRDGLPLHQAVLVLRSREGGALPERELAGLAASLAARGGGTAGRAELGPFLADAVAAGGADDLVTAAEASAERRAVQEALERAIDALAPGDRQLLRMRFWDDLTVAEISRRLDVPQKPLYRRIARALATLRRRLETSGVSRRHTLALVAELAA